MPTAEWQVCARVHAGACCVPACAAPISTLEGLLSSSTQEKFSFMRPIRFLQISSPYNRDVKCTVKPNVDVVEVVDTGSSL